MRSCCGADERIPLYVLGRSVPPPPVSGRADPFAEAQRLLPATATVDVWVPHDSVLATSILVLYGAVLIAVLFSYNRRVARLEAGLVESAVADRDATAQRAASIETELEQVRKRLADVEPAEHAQAEEIRELGRERQVLQAKLAELASRETELRASTSRFVELEDERRALEDLLGEAVEDLGHKESVIQGLQDRLKRAAKSEPPPAAGGRQRGWEQLERRLRTLYRNLEIDDRAIDDLIALRDETMKLKAEEAIKRLADGSDDRRDPAQGRRAPAAPFDLRAGIRRQRPHLLHARAAALLPRALGGREEHPKRGSRIPQPPPGLSARRRVAFSLPSSQGLVISARTPSCSSCSGGISSVQPVISIRIASGRRRAASARNCMPLVPGMR